MVAKSVTMGKAFIALFCNRSNRPTEEGKNYLYTLPYFENGTKDRFVKFRDGSVVVYSNYTKDCVDYVRFLELVNSDWVNPC